RRVAAPARSWPVAGAVGRRPDERLAGAGRAGGDGGLCAARCGRTALAGRRGELLTVWPGLGQHGPGTRRSPRRVPPWGVAPAGGPRCLPAWSRRAPDPYPPEDRGPALGPF